MLVLMCQTGGSIQAEMICWLQNRLRYNRERTVQNFANLYKFIKILTDLRLEAARAVDRSLLRRRRLRSSLFPGAQEHC